MKSRVPVSEIFKISNINIIKFLFLASKLRVPEKLDSGRMVWLFGLWTAGHLDSGRLDGWTLDAWTLDDWTLDGWILDDWTLGPWTSGRLDSARVDAWNQEILSIFSGIYFSLLII